MLPTFTALFDGHRWHCQKRGIRYTQRDLYDAQIGIARARLLAVGLTPRTRATSPPRCSSRSCSR